MINQIKQARTLTGCGLFGCKRTAYKPTNTKIYNIMKTEMTTYECAKALTHDEFAAWTRSGAFALVEYLEQMEDDCGTQIEFDPVALRCEFSEYESLQDFAKERWSDDCHMHWATDKVIRDFIEPRSTLIEFDGGLIVQDF